MMATLKTKKRSMYIVFAFIFLCGGIEYAVILPTLWLYLHNEYGVPEYMLGLVLSAYSLSAALSSPVTGRICDRTRNTKTIFIVCTLFELGGSVLYLADISVWMCLLSRFISGLGAGSEAIVFAEVARHTAEKDRTGIMSKLAAIRQIALLLGPGLNVFLRKADFQVGPFNVNKYTSPAGFLIGIWILLLVIVLLLYYEPAKIYAQEMAESKCVTESGESIQRGRVVRAPAGVTDDSGYLAQQDLPREPKVSEYTRKRSVNSPVLGPSKPRGGSRVQNLAKFPETSALGTSYDLMISAENYIFNRSASAAQRTSIGEENGGDSESLIFDEGHFDDESVEMEERYTVRGDSALFSGEGSLSEEEKMLLPGDRRGQNGLPNENQPYIQRSMQVLDDPIAREGKLGFFCNEYIRDEVVAIVYVIFCTMFSQICVETMVTPLSLKYLDFGELENSLMYCACGVEIIIVFIMVTVISRCVCDRNMIIFGAITNLASNVWLIWFIPQAKLHDLGGNLPFFTIPVVLDVLSLPFLFVCSTSLFSKLTRKQTQGLSQGLRRAVVGMGTILAPLWGSSTVNSPYLLFGVLIAIQGLALLLLMASFRKLKVWQKAPGDDVDPALPTLDGETQSLLHRDIGVPSGRSLAASQDPSGALRQDRQGQNGPPRQASYQSLYTVDC